MTELMKGNGGKSVPKERSVYEEGYRVDCLLCRSVTGLRSITCNRDAYIEGICSRYTDDRGDYTDYVCDACWEKIKDKKFIR